MEFVFVFFDLWYLKVNRYEILVKINKYKIIEILGMFLLVKRCVCKYSSDVLDLYVYLRIIYKSKRVFLFCV